MAWQGMGLRANLAGRGKAGHGLARQGWAGQGMGLRAKTRTGLGKVPCQNVYESVFWRLKMVLQESFVNDLFRGCEISSDVVAELMGVDPTDQRGLEFAAVKLAGTLQNLLWKNEQIWSVQARQGSVKILTDREAVHFQKRRRTTGVRKLRNAARGLQGVDTYGLSTQDRATCEREQRLATAQASAVDRIREPVIPKHNQPDRPSSRPAKPPTIKAIAPTQPRA